MESQAQQIKQHLLDGNKITPIDALTLFGCFRLGARIFDLKSDGMAIKTDIIEKDGKRFAEYSLI